MMAPWRVLGLAALAGACSSTQALPPNYAPARAAIHDADAVGAQKEPRAARHLELARQQLAEARTLARNGKRNEALLALDCARTDAELALMLTREAQARADAVRAAQDVQRLGKADSAEGVP
jgi:glycerol-3-phosphate dehydrogenase